MKPSETFLGRSSAVWAAIKYSSEQLGYSCRATKKHPQAGMRKYEMAEIQTSLRAFKVTNETTRLVLNYMNYRADIIETRVQHLLMDRDEARQLYENLTSDHSPTCHLPYNKQKGELKHLAYLTCITNVLTEINLGGRNFNDNPGRLTTVTDSEDRLASTLSRRIDGAYPDVVNPRAIWEVKEYYGTTTFGSRVADGVYETQLDGYELREARENSSRRIEHYLLVDDKFTWWHKGRSYLCRLIDLMHMGLVDEVLFGKEVMERWPEIVRSWI